MHHSMDQLFRLENTFTVIQSPESNNIVYAKCESSYCWASSSLHWIRLACSWRLDRSLVHCRLGRPREKRRVRSPRQTIQGERNWDHESARFFDMFLRRVFMQTRRPCRSCLATQTDNSWALRRGGGGEPPTSFLAVGKPHARYD